MGDVALIFALVPVSVRIGNEYRDFFGGHGALMLGHSHPRVTQAIQRAAANGVQFAANHPLEVEWAEIIQKYTPTAQSARVLNEKLGVGVGLAPSLRRASDAEREREKMLDQLGDVCGGVGGELGRRLEAWLVEKSPERGDRPS